MDRFDQLDDMIKTVGTTFLGLTIHCARCHDHKFDPIAQADYYRLQAFFTPLLLRDDVPLATSAQRAEFASAQAAWERKTAVVREEIAAIEAPFIRKTAEVALAKFPPATQALLAAHLAEAYRVGAQEHLRGGVPHRPPDRWSPVPRARRGRSPFAGVDG